MTVSFMRGDDEWCRLEQMPVNHKKLGPVVDSVLWHVEVDCVAEDSNRCLLLGCVPIFKAGGCDRYVWVEQGFSEHNQLGCTIDHFALRLT